MTASRPADSLAVRVRRTSQLVRVLAPREIRIRYRQSALDVAWALITPASMAAVYGVVLTRSFNADGAGAPYFSMAWCGLVLWMFFANSLGTAVTSLISSADLVTKVYFPREALPLAAVAASMVDLFVGLLTVCIILPVQGVTFGVSSLALVLPLLVLVVWTTAIATLLAVIASFIRDVTHLVSLFIRVGFFATPVMYDASILPGPLRWTATFSPIAVAITGFRDAVLHQRALDVTLLSAHLLVGLGVVFLSILYTRAVEDRIADAV